MHGFFIVSVLGFRYVTVYDKYKQLLDGQTAQQIADFLADPDQTLVSFSKVHIEQLIFNQYSYVHCQSCCINNFAVDLPFPPSLHNSLNHFPLIPVTHRLILPLWQLLFTPLLASCSFTLVVVTQKFVVEETYCRKPFTKTIEQTGLQHTGDSATSRTEERKQSKYKTKLQRKSVENTQLKSMPYL